MVKMKKIEFQLVLDIDMYLFFEKVTSGGVCYISKRYSKISYKVKMLQLKKSFFQQVDSNGS